jgi:hypothetical protein
MRHLKVSPGARFELFEEDRNSFAGPPSVLLSLLKLSDVSTYRSSPDDFITFSGLAKNASISFSRFHLWLCSSACVTSQFKSRSDATSSINARMIGSISAQSMMLKESLGTTTPRSVLFSPDMGVLEVDFGASAPVDSLRPFEGSAGAVPACAPSSSYSGSPSSSYSPSSS